MSVRHGARPVTTSGSDSSTTSLPLSSLVVTSASDSPSSSSSKPMRLNADRAFGLAKVVMPSTSRRMRPSEARGAPRRGPVGAPRSGKSPDAIIWKSSSAHSLNVSSCRLGVRVAPRFVCRVITATGSGASCVPVADSRRITGTARTRVGVSSYQSGADESTMRAVANACGHEVAPLRLDLLADEVAVEERRRARGRACATATKSSSPDGTHSTMSAKARSASSCRSPTSMCSQSTSA